jgi:hypothetical protein
MAFRIRGLDAAQFERLFGADVAELARAGVERHQVKEKPGAPCRITLEDAEPGETVLLLSHRHQPAMTPYRQEGPIFIRETARAACEAIDIVPPALAIRMLSVRAFNAEGSMLDADLVDGQALPGLIERFWANPEIAYAQAHYARRGCFAATITRA